MSNGLTKKIRSLLNLVKAINDDARSRAPKGSIVIPAPIALPYEPKKEGEKPKTAAPASISAPAPKPYQLQGAAENVVDAHQNNNLTDEQLTHLVTNPKFKNNFTADGYQYLKDYHDQAVVNAPPKYVVTDRPEYIDPNTDEELLQAKIAHAHGLHIKDKGLMAGAADAIKERMNQIFKANGKYWKEGAYLTPDNDSHYRHLEASLSKALNDFKEDPSDTENINSVNHYSDLLRKKMTVLIQHNDAMDRALGKGKTELTRPQSSTEKKSTIYPLSSPFKKEHVDAMDQITNPFDAMKIINQAIEQKHQDQRHEQGSKEEEENFTGAKVNNLLGHLYDVIATVSPNAAKALTGRHEELNKLYRKHKDLSAHLGNIGTTYEGQDIQPSPGDFATRDKYIAELNQLASQIQDQKKSIVGIGSPYGRDRKIIEKIKSFMKSHMGNPIYTPPSPFKPEHIGQLERSDALFATKPEKGETLEKFNERRAQALINIPLNAIKKDRLLSQSQKEGLLEAYKKLAWQNRSQNNNTPNVSKLFDTVLNYMVNHRINPTYPLSEAQMATRKKELQERRQKKAYQEGKILTKPSTEPIRRLSPEEIEEHKSTKAKQEQEEAARIALNQPRQLSPEEQEEQRKERFRAQRRLQEEAEKKRLESEQKKKERQR